MALADCNVRPLISNHFRETLEQVRGIVKCLTVICLNTHNIPLVASMDFVTHITQLNTLLLQHLLNMESAFFSSKVSHTDIVAIKLEVTSAACLQLSM